MGALEQQTRKPKLKIGSMKNTQIYVNKSCKDRDRNVQPDKGFRIYCLINVR